MTEETVKKDPLYSLIDTLREGGYIDDTDGEWKCKRCHSRVHIDWFEQTAECQGCDDLPEPDLEFQVVVGNIGTVHECDTLGSAMSVFNDYVEMSKSGSGKASGESVNLLRKGEVIESYAGTQESE